VAEEHHDDRHQPAQPARPDHRGRHAPPADQGAKALTDLLTHAFHEKLPAADWRLTNGSQLHATFELPGGVRATLAVDLHDDGSEHDEWPAPGIGGGPLLRSRSDRANLLYLRAPTARLSGSSFTARGSDHGVAQAVAESASGATADYQFPHWSPLLVHGDGRAKL